MEMPIDSVNAPASDLIVPPKALEQVRRLFPPEEELEIAYKGEPLDIGFNITYLLDVLHNLAADRVVLALGDANSSALITMPERGDYKYVVMPMRI